MVRTRGRHSFINRCGQPKCGVHPSMHGQLAIDLGHIPYFGLSTGSDGGSLHASSNSTTLSSSILLSSIPSSFSHHCFRFSYTPSTLSPHHTYNSSSPHSAITNLLPYPSVLPV